MNTTASPANWRDELSETLAVCTQRANLPAALPHCAICARYATDNLPFEALMSLLEVMPKKLRAESVAIAEAQLATVRPSLRQQHVEAITLPVLMESPGWPLVRSLVIDMADQSIHQLFDDPRLKAIEEITLLGFAYGGCEIRPDFAKALFHSRALVNVRSLEFHSIERDPAVSKQFWKSPMSRRLHRIIGMGYFGEPIGKPLKVRELAIVGYSSIPEGFSLKPLLDPAISPHLRELSLAASMEGISPFLELLARESKSLDRVGAVGFHFTDWKGDLSRLIRSASFPASTKSVTWYTDFKHVSIIRPRRMEHRLLYDFTSDEVDIRFGDRLTDYGTVVFDWNLRQEISRRVESLSLLLPLKFDLAELFAFLDELPAVTRLSLIYPFDESELERLLDSERIRQLESLTLCLVVEGGQWDPRNKYMKSNRARYQSKIPPKKLFELAFAERTKSILQFSIAAASFDLSRSADRIQHCDIYAANAGLALAQINPPYPIERLCFYFTLEVNERLMAALTKSDLLSKVYRLAFWGEIDEPAARLLAACPQLRNVRDFLYHGGRSTEETCRAILQSPNLRGVWDLSLTLPQPWEAPWGEMLCAESPLLDRAVAFDLDGVGRSLAIPQSGRLARVRRLGEGIAYHVFGDARLARAWKDHPLGSALKAKAARVVETTYRVEHKLSALPELATKLLAENVVAGEDQFRESLRRMFATAFRGRPAPDGTAYVDLNMHQQLAIRTVAELDQQCWNYGGLVRDVTVSYGFGWWDRENVIAYIEGRKDEDGAGE